MLKDNGITATVKQTGTEFTDLKNYYGGQKRMIQSSKSSGAGADEVYVIPGKFYESLQFLTHAFTPRKTKSNANDEDDGSPCVEAKPSSAKISKKLALAQNNELYRGMSTATTALESVISSKKNQKPQGEDVDDTFGKLLVGQLKLISGCDLKDDIKISLQKMVLKCKRQVNLSNKMFSQSMMKIIWSYLYICILKTSYFRHLLASEYPFDIISISNNC